MELNGPDMSVKSQHLKRLELKYLSEHCKDLMGAVKALTIGMRILSQTQQSLLERIVKLEIKDQDIK